MATDFYAFSFALGASLLVALVIVFTQRFHGHLTLDSHAGVQKLHALPTPRVGGIALMCGTLVGALSLPSQTQHMPWLILIAALPAFTAGLVEDITKRVGVKIRLLATIFAGLIFSTLTNYHITRVDIPVIDGFFALWLPALLFTAVAIGGIANAINIIDGVNGLASGTSIIILSAFAVLAWKVGDHAIVGVCLISIGALAGFFLLNFPLGRIFLGDAGAYATGFVLAVVAVALPERNAEISPLIGLLALSYPVTETMVSIHRRVVREGTNPGQPDRLHLHSLIYRSRARRLAQRIGAPHLRNALTGLMLMALPLLSSMLMVVFHDETAMIILSIALVAMIYLLIYRKVALLSTIGTSARVS